VILLTAACAKDKDAFTVVRGRVTDKYTGRGLARARVVVYQLTPNFTSMHRDSVAAAVTDSSGAYQLSFNASGKSRHRYHIRLFSDSIFDLTTYPDLLAATYGTELAKGGHNEVNFTATPFKTVTVHLDANKGGKNYLSVGCSTIDRGASFGVSMLDDTARANQHFSLVLRVRLLPMRTYRFRATTSNRVRSGLSNYDFVDYGPTLSRERQVLYNDTTTIILR
jgi:hypothetical protein